MKKAYLGIDIGSISTKGVIIDSNNNILASEYIETSGNPIKAVKTLISLLKEKFDNNIYSVSTETAREVSLSKPGDKVKIEYMNVGDSRYIIVNSFENANTSPKDKNDSIKDEKKVS